MTTRWTAGAYGLAAALILGVAACMWGVPLPLSDNLLLILDAQRTSLVDGLQAAFMDRGVLRPFYWAQYKVLFELSGGHYYAAFQGFHVAMFAATVLLTVATLRVRTAAEWAGAACALVVLLGLHTFGNLVREQPILVVTCCALAYALAFAETPALWRDALAVANLLLAMFIAEIGLLVWVVHTAAFLCGRRGVSRVAVATLSVLGVGYFALRFLVLPSGALTLFPRETGYGFSLLDSEELRRRFGDRPLVLYAYNVMASISSVLLSEPRTGVFEFVSRLRAGALRPWMWLNVGSSLLTTAALAWFLIRSRRDLWRRDLTRGQAMVVAGIVVVIANGVISYPYSRDVTMSPAGLAYAIAVGPVVVSILEQGARLRAVRQAALIALLVVASSAWTLRTVALTFTLRTTAFVNRNDWAAAEEWLQGVGRMPVDARGQALVQTLKVQALDFDVPNPGIAQQSAEAYFGTGAY